MRDKRKIDDRDDIPGYVPIHERRVGDGWRPASQVAHEEHRRLRDAMGKFANDYEILSVEWSEPGSSGRPYGSYHGHIADVPYADFYNVYTALSKIPSYAEKYRLVVRWNSKSELTGDVTGCYFITSDSMASVQSKFDKDDKNITNKIYQIDGKTLDGPSFRKFIKEEAERQAELHAESINDQTLKEAIAFNFFEDDYFDKADDKADDDEDHENELVRDVLEKIENVIPRDVHELRHEKYATAEFDPGPIRCPVASPLKIVALPEIFFGAGPLSAGVLG